MFTTETTTTRDGLIIVAFGFHDRRGAFTCVRPSKTYKTQAAADRAIRAWAAR